MLRSSTTVVEQGKKFNNVQWAEGSLFAPPLNVQHQHFNDDSSKPARLLAVTTAALAFFTDFGKEDEPAATVVPVVTDSAWGVGLAVRF